MDHPARRNGYYLVSLSDNSTLDQHWETFDYNPSSTATFRYFDGINVYFAQLAPALLRRVRGDTNVLAVEADHRLCTVDESSTNSSSSAMPSSDFNYSTTHWSARPTQWAETAPASPTAPDEIDTEVDTGCQPAWSEVGRSKAPWNLQVISAGEELPLPIKNNERGYPLVDNAGKGVDIYIFDNGIRIDHRDFQGRAKNIFNLRPNAWSPFGLVPPARMKDMLGHGTAVAGVAGANPYGVAQHANLVSVKIANKKEPLLSSLIDGLNAATEIHIDKKADPKLRPWLFRGSVFNISIIWFADPKFDGLPSLRKAIAWAVAEGVFIVTCAGNQNIDATDTILPCSLPFVTCVSAIDNKYNKLGMANWGSIIDYLAPGEDIPVLWVGSRTSLGFYSGTSFAAPHVAGIAAIFISWHYLVDGGVETYLRKNSYNILSTGWTTSRKGRPLTSLRLANTGIRSTRKSEDEPFVGAGQAPSPG